MATLAEIRQQYPDYGDMTDSALADALYSKFYSDVPRDAFDAKIGIAAPAVPGAVSAPAAAPAAAPAEDGALSRIAETAKQAFGDQELGMSAETRNKYPGLAVWQPLVAAPADFVVRGMSSLLAGGSAAIAEVAKKAGMSDADANRLTRDLYVIGQGALVESGLGPKAPRAGAVVERPSAAPAEGAPRPGGPALPGAAVAEAVPTVVEAAPKTAAEAKASSQAFYRKAEEAGVTLKPESYTQLSKEIEQTATKNRLDPTLTPDSVAALKRIQELEGKPVTFETLDTMRQIANDAQSAVRPNDRRIAGLIVDKIDDFIDKMGGKDVLSGDARVAADTIVKARDLWAKGSRLEVVNNLVERAKSSAPNFSQSGIENALRTEFRALSKNERAMRKFSEEQQDAIKKVARGGLLANSARNVGRMAPTGPVSASLGIGAPVALATTALGPIAGLAVGSTIAATAFSARHLATALTRRNIAALEKTILKNGESKSALAALSRSRSLLQALQDTAANIGTGSAAAPAAAAASGPPGK